MPATAATIESQVRRYLPLVHAVALRVGRSRRAQRDPAVESADLVASGLLGLFEAARRFDPKRRVTLGQYARPRVHGRMVDQLRRQDRVSVSPDRMDVEDLPDVTESLDGRGPVRGPAEIILARERARHVSAGVDRLRPLARMVIRLCYFEDRLQVEAARELGLTESGVSRIHQEALRSLRQTLADA